jgi:hypothetical protein
MMAGWICESAQGDVHNRWVMIVSAQEILSARLDGPCRCGAVAPRTAPQLICLPRSHRCLVCGRGPRHDWALKVPGHREQPRIVCPVCGTEAG